MGQVGESLPRCGSVASLGAVLLSADREHGSREARGKTLEYPSALLVIESSRRCQVEAELNPRIGRADPLATGARGSRELFGQFAFSDRQTKVGSGSRSHS